MIIAILLVMFNIFLLIFPQNVLAAARDGLLLWFNNVLPSLLPFMIVTNMLVMLGFAELLARFLAPFMRRFFNLPGAAGFGLVTGLTSGYPMGAKTVSDLYREKQLNTRQAQHLLAFCNNAGPLFILGAVGVGMFNSTRIGYILWISHVLGAFAVGFLLKPKDDSMYAREEKRENSLSNAHSIGKMLGEAVRNSMDSITVIGGLIIFFSVVISVFDVLGLPSDTVFGGVVGGLVEVTSGARRIATLTPSVITLAAAAFVVAFGGFSVHAQTFHFVAGTGIRVRGYLLAKLLHGVIAACICALIWILLADIGERASLAPAADVFEKSGRACINTDVFHSHMQM
ncbi:MAG: hypothetical protein FWB80_15410 [Defluviitaleaceae bacterium]|nr:hypothetical protein [Defluviitaleaceae bacterium]